MRIDAKDSVGFSSKRCRESLVLGVGFNSGGEFKAKRKGKHTREYQAWINMLQRCYDKKYQGKQPTYVGCSVCIDWLDYQNFAKWYYDNHPNDDGKYNLDKDLKVIGSKVYSPETCMIIPNIVNTFIVDCGARRGSFLIGVSFHKRVGKFVSRCSNPITKKCESLGCFTDEIDAHLAWRKRKSELACELAITQQSHEVKKALIGWKMALDSNLIHTY